MREKRIFIGEMDTDCNCKKLEISISYSSYGTAFLLFFPYDAYSIEHYGAPRTIMEYIDYYINRNEESEVTFEDSDSFFEHTLVLNKDNLKFVLWGNDYPISEEDLLKFYNMLLECY